MESAEKSRVHLKSIRFLLPPAFWLGVWQFCAMAVDHHVSGRGNELLLPYPATVFWKLTELVQQLPFWESIGATMARILVGLALGILAGCLLAALTSLVPWADLFLSPAIRVIRAAPVVSFILLVLLWTGKSNVPVVISGLMVLPVMWGGVSQAIRAIDPKLLEMAKVYRLGRWKTLRLVCIPSVLPAFRASAATSLGLAWKSGVAAEVLCLPELSIGFHIYRSRQYLETPELFAWTAMVVALSLLLEQILRLAWGRKGEKP